MTTSLRHELIQTYILLLLSLNTLRFVTKTIDGVSSLEGEYDPYTAEEVLKQLLTALRDGTEPCREHLLPGKLPAADHQRHLRVLVEDCDEDRLARRLRGLRTELRDVAPTLHLVG